MADFPGRGRKRGFHDEYEVRWFVVHCPVNHRLLSALPDSFQASQSKRRRGEAVQSAATSQLLEAVRNGDVDQLERALAEGGNANAATIPNRPTTTHTRRQAWVST